MIAFEEELKKFDFFNIDSSFKDTESELVNVFREVNSTLSRISKEQDKANIQLEEIMLVFDEIKEKDETIKRLEKSLDSSEREKLSIIKGLIEILDEVENLYRLSMKEGNESWRQQVSLMWGLISKVLFSIGMTRIDDEITMFSPFLNNVIGVKSNIELGEGIILEVLKSGYTYKGIILRKSDVIVNRHMKVAEEQYTEERYTEERYVEEQWTEEQCAKEQDVDEQDIDEQSIDEQDVEEEGIDEKDILRNRVLMRRVLRSRILMRRVLGNSVLIRRIIGSNPLSTDNLLKISILKKIMLKTRNGRSTY